MTTQALKPSQAIGNPNSGLMYYADDTSVQENQRKHARWINKLLSDLANDVDVSIVRPNS